MKRQILSIATVLALTAAGAGFAQSTLNTTAPGPTQQQEPGQTNNNLPNPGNPVPTPTNQQPVQEQGTVSGTATESMTGNQGANTTGQVPTTTTGTMQNELQNEEGMDVDVDTGANAEGAIDVDVNRTSDADTDASGIDETGNLDNESGTYSGDTNTGSLPQTAGELPTLALFGMLALFGAFMVRRIARA
jgi:cobalamin biosynthesis Mg chelatase CobN